MHATTMGKSRLPITPHYVARVLGMNGLGHKVPRYARQTPVPITGPLQHKKITDECLQNGAGGTRGFERDSPEWAGSA